MSGMRPEKLAAIVVDLKYELDKHPVDRTTTAKWAKIYGVGQNTIGVALRQLGWACHKSYAGNTCTRYWTPPAGPKHNIDQSKLRDILKRGARTYDQLAAH